MSPPSNASSPNGILKNPPANNAASISHSELYDCSPSEMLVAYPNVHTNFDLFIKNGSDALSANSQFRLNSDNTAVIMTEDANDFYNPRVLAKAGLRRGKELDRQLVFDLEEACLEVTNSHTARIKNVMVVPIPGSIRGRRILTVKRGTQEKRVWDDSLGEYVVSTMMYTRITVLVG
jgi:hypothetical protein